MKISQKVFLNITLVVKKSMVRGTALLKRREAPSNHACCPFDRILRQVQDAATQYS